MRARSLPSHLLLLLLLLLLLVLAGTMLRFHGSQAAVTTPVQRQQLKHTAKFYLTNDIDITVQTLRNTLGVSCATNEKVGAWARGHAHTGTRACTHTPW